jgi:PleD family two-component response regulator
VIVHTGKDLTKRETTKIKKLAETIIIKDADSLESLVDETALFLHRDVADLNESQKNMMKRVNLIDPRLEGKKVLVVDDDIRNIFALTSALERQQMQVVYAENGETASKCSRKRRASKAF